MNKKINISNRDWLLNDLTRGIHIGPTCGFFVSVEDIGNYS